MMMMEGISGVVGWNLERGYAHLSDRDPETTWGTFWDKLSSKHRNTQLIMYKQSEDVYSVSL